MKNALIGRNVNVTVAFSGINETGYAAEKSSTAVPMTYTGVVSDYTIFGENSFIVLNGNFYISLRYVQTIAVLN